MRRCADTLMAHAPAIPPPPHHPTTPNQILGPTAQWIRSQLTSNGCIHCGRALTPIIEGMVENNDHDVS